MPATAAELTTTFDAVADVLGMYKGTGAAEVQCTMAEMGEKIRRLSNADIEALTKSVISTHLASLKQRVNLRLSKQALIEQLKRYRDDLLSGRATVPLDIEPHTEQDPATLARNLISDLRKTSLKSWVMRPLVAIRGMKEGSMNEKFVLHALPSFISKQSTVLSLGENAPDTSIHAAQYEINYLKEVGLLSNKGNEILGDSPDGVCTLFDRMNSKHYFCAFEVKTMTAVATIDGALGIA